jgi:hypothetical protein
MHWQRVTEDWEQAWPCCPQPSSPGSRFTFLALPFRLYSVAFIKLSLLHPKAPPISTIDDWNWREISNDFDATVSVIRMLWRRGPQADEYASGGSDDLRRNRVKLARLGVSS